MSFGLLINWYLWAQAPAISGFFLGSMPQPTKKCHLAYKSLATDICGHKRPQLVVSSWEGYLGLGWTRQRVKMESPPRLGLRTIYIVPLWKDWSYQSTCPEFRSRDEKGLGTQPHLTYKLASTHCVPNPNPIKGSSNRLFYTHTHKSILTCI